ncbi:cation:proton antiporter [Pseudonocardia endophytica]|uniref:Sodium/proton antiporter (CPA1 family) n=1 Tax=Pseudonocardia endophytica TaxID=401976 RepID=A0A4R1HDG2_PSEEN|nr:sodium:proton antiporter [Pseudonocardia endophytica]TCK20097.1 sodium/proton antiporter (CPA1 family) [Pseudonocardia endophytica]
MNGVQILLIVGIGIAVSAVAGRKGFESGMVVVVLAAAASFIPGVPRLELDSELILALVIPPLLYSGARGATMSSFAANLRPIISLGVMLVVLTTGALGLISSWLLPGLGLAAAFLLGAVLAPPDTITTVSRGDEIGLPKRVTSILTGESLVNDAIALTLFSIALEAVNGHDATWAGGIKEFAFKAGVGLLIGGVLAVAALWLRKRLRNPTLETALILLVPFTAYLTAEELDASGILAVVMASFSVTANLTLDPKHQYPGGYRTRLQEEGVWQVLDFLLTTFVFAYIGLQLKFVLTDLADSDGLVRTLVAAGVLLAAAIVLRLVGVFGLFGRWTLRHRMIHRRADRDPRYRERLRQVEERQRQRGGEPLAPPSMKDTLLVGWTGMRGILTLAAASAIPQTTATGVPFPGRDAIQGIALIVTLGTLVIQGTTLGWLARVLKSDHTADRETAESMDLLGREIIASMPSTTDADFDAQRHALAVAVHEHRLDEETARRMIDAVDLRQAAERTRD